MGKFDLRQMGYLDTNRTTYMLLKFTNSFEDFFFFKLFVLLLADFIRMHVYVFHSSLINNLFQNEFQDSADSNVISSEIYHFCSHRLETYWILSIYIYKGLFLAFGVFLAWETRNITVPELNDSKYIGACIYNVVVIIMFGVPLLHVLPVEQRTLKFLLESCLIFFSTTICQCIMFIPKVMYISLIYSELK